MQQIPFVATLRTTSWLELLAARLRQREQV